MSLPSNELNDIVIEMAELNRLYAEYRATRLRRLREVNDLALQMRVIDDRLDTLVDRHEIVAGAEADLKADSMKQAAEQYEVELIEDATLFIAYQNGKHRYNTKPAKQLENQSNPSDEQQ